MSLFVLGRYSRRAWAAVLLLSTIVFLILFSSSATARRGPTTPHQVTQDDSWHYTSVGNLGLTVTNFGILGQGFNNPDQPSCEYKFRSALESRKDEVEHFSYAGIWVGGVRDGQTKVTTAIMDGVLEQGTDEGGWEFTSSFTEQIEYNPVFEHLAKIDRRFDLSRVPQGIVGYADALDAEIEDGVIQFGSTAWDTMITRSSIREVSPTNPYGQVYDPDAVSHQDLIAAFTDTNTFVPGTGVTIHNHDPLGVHVYLETYAWNFSYADAFAILNYTVTNIPTGWFIAQQDTVMNYGGGVERAYAVGDTVWKGSTIEAPYFGIWLDSSVGNMTYTPDDAYGQSGPGGSWTWYDNLNDYVPERRLAMQYDYDGDAGWAQSYLGVKVLGSESVIGDPMPEEWDTYYHQWTWTGSAFGQEYPMPQDEQSRYDVMGNHIAYGNLPDNPDYQNSWMMLLTCGPMPDMAPGDRYNTALAIVCGRWNGSSLEDDDERRQNLYVNAEWAQIAYNGEDRNGNGELDPGEDRDGDGEITRYILPEPPPSPELVVEAGDRTATLYWNNSPEFTVDPISNKRDFEGYRIYGSPKTVAPDSLEKVWTLLADYDVDYDLDPADEDSTLLGYNTGFEAIELEEPIVVNGVEVNYKWVNHGLKDGWPRELYYAVTSYDRGDPVNGLQSLESNPNNNLTYVFPGTKPAGPDDERVSVYPNPYRGRAAWDGPTGRDRLIWFRYLPARCEVTIFTLAGERVDRFTHNSATYRGDDVQRINSGATANEQRAFSGGEHAWDLLTEDDQEIATGLYVYTVENLDTGDVKTGKFLVIK